MTHPSASVLVDTGTELKNVSDGTVIGNGSDGSGIEESEGSGGTIDGAVVEGGGEDGGGGGSEETVGHGAVTVTGEHVCGQEACGDIGEDCGA